MDNLAGIALFTLISNGRNQFPLPMLFLFMYLKEHMCVYACMYKTGPFTAIMSVIKFTIIKF